MKPMSELSSMLVDELLYEVERSTKTLMAIALMCDDVVDPVGKGVMKAALCIMNGQACTLDTLAKVLHGLEVE